MPPLFVQTSRASRFTPSPLWYNRFQYTEERERGFDWEEDLFLPGIIEVPVERKCTVILSVSCGHDAASGPRQDPIVSPTTLWKTEVVRRRTSRRPTKDDRRIHR